MLSSAIPSGSSSFLRGCHARDRAGLQRTIDGAEGRRPFIAVTSSEIRFLDSRAAECGQPGGLLDALLDGLADRVGGLADVAALGLGVGAEIAGDLQGFG